MATHSTSEGPTDRLARFVAGCVDSPLSPEISERATTAMLDALGLGLAAKDNLTVQAFVKLTSELANPKCGATIWGRKTVVSTLEAVAANAMAVHARFQDDCDMTSWAHPGSLIVAPAVSMGESLDTNVEQVLRAIACGYAVIYWLGGQEVVGRGVVGRGFRASPVFGSIGAAATASVILGLSVEHAHNALAMAADLTGGVLEPVGSGADTWRIQNGTAAQRGVLCALMAKEGVVGSPRALEGPNGLLHSFAGLDEVPSVWKGDPDVTSMLSVWAKPYPTLGDNIAVVSAALAMRDEGLDVAAIESIEVHQNAHFASYPGTSFRGPFVRPAQAMASTAFAVSATLLYGPLYYRIYGTHLADAQIMAMIDRLTVVPEKKYGYVDGMVEITLNDGSKVRKASSELLRSLFYRDRDSAVAAFDSLLLETGYDEAARKRVPDAVYASVDVASATSIRSVIAAL